MRLHIAAIGKGRGEPEQVLCDDYVKRASGLAPRLGFPKLSFYEGEVSRAREMPARKREEAERLLGFLPEQTHVIALDEHGKPRTSADFAQHLAKLRDAPTRDLAFVIGGPDGLDREALKPREVLCLGPQTWPHLLVRAMLAEQVYRALAILAGHPYHRV